MELEYYVPEDFASDESFVNYCFQLDPKDMSFWEQWITDHPERKEIAEQARAWVFQASIRATPEDKQQQWEKLKESLNKRPEREEKARHRQLRFISKTGAGAAVLLVLIVGVMAFYWRMGKKVKGALPTETPLLEYVTSGGQRQSVFLSDGTEVWLNADSKLICSDSFQTGQEREVTLIGEAYFKVTRDPLKPFIIHTEKMNIKVLGTELNIEAYPDAIKEVASLISGSIQVSLAHDPAKKIILKPNQKITVLNKEIVSKNADLNPKTITPDQAKGFVILPLRTDPLLDSGTIETAWVEGKLVFRNETFDQLAIQMERWYDVNIYFENSSVEEYRFTGIFSTETIDQALQALQMTSPSDPFKFKVDGKNVYISQERK